MILKETTHQTLRVEKRERRPSGVWRKRRMWRTWNIHIGDWSSSPRGLSLSPQCLPSASAILLLALPPQDHTFILIVPLVL